ncbi:MAG: glycosyltransferase family 9 protein [Bdellovibrionota bacterium]
MQVSRILVRAPNWIGDQIMAYPFFHFLRRAHPKAEIVSACAPWVEAIQFRNLVDDVYVMPAPDGPRLRDRFRAMELASRELAAKGGWDLGFTLPDSFSAAWVLYRAGVKRRRGYRADGRGILLSEAQNRDEKNFPHRSEAYVKLLPMDDQPKAEVRKFWGEPPENDLDPAIPGELSRFEPLKSWPQARPVDPPKESYWVLAPGSKADARRWAPERFTDLARRISSETGMIGLIVGGAAEARLAQELVEDRSLKLQDWTAQGGVSDYWRIFQEAEFTVSNDSGLAHVAALCGSPTQVIWGAGDPKHTEPLGPGKVRISMNPVECWPCEKNFCPLEDSRKLQCLRGIEAERVWKEIQDGIRRPSAS